LVYTSRANGIIDSKTFILRHYCLSPTFITGNALEQNVISNKEIFQGKYRMFVKRF
jgi:hypothetical protein